MKKILVLAVLSLVSLCLLASCGGQKDGHTHNFGEWDVTEKPTCSEKGTKVRYCSCGEKQTEVIATLDHSFSDWVTVKEPTTTEVGLKERTCACGEKETQKIDKRPVTYSKGLEFTLNDDDQSYTVTGIGTCTDTDVFIPNTYEGLPVTSIGKFAFEDCTGLTSIVIPDSVTSIGNWAFDGCTGLTSIVIPDGVTSIGNQAFFSCTGLTSIVIPDNVTSIEDFAFYGCTGLTSIVIPDSVTSIGNYAFCGCSDLADITADKNNKTYKSIDGSLYTKDEKTLVQYAIGKKNSSFTIPDSVTSIGDDAFYGCTGLTSVVIGDSVTSIGDGAFHGCTGLTSIVIGDSVTSIGSSAFSGSTSLNSIKIPDSVTSIGSYAFYGCTGLTSIVIPDRVTRIDWSAFDGCKSLTDVYYTGSEAEWAEISIDSWHNLPLTSATIHYNHVPTN